MFHPDAGGGAARSAYLLAHALRSAGIHVTVATTAPGPDRKTNVNGIPVYELSPRNLYWVGDKAAYRLARIPWQALDFWNPLMYGALRRVIATERPDLVHVQKLRGLSPSVWAAARAENISAVVQTCRDFEIMSPQGTLSGRIGQWAAGGRWLLPYQAPRRALSRAVDAVIFPSRHMLGAFEQHRFFSEARKVVVANTHGDTVETVQRRQLSCEEKAPDRRLRLLYLGRLEASKGVWDLCRAVCSLEPHFPVVLDVGGGGTDEHQLRSLYGDRDHRIVFHGHLDQPGKDKLLRDCDVLVMPTRLPEAFGNVVAEAFAFGKPVIGSNIGAIPELITHGITGVLVPPGNETALRESIAAFASGMLNARDFREACFASGRRYSLESMTDKHIQLYDSLLTHSAGSAG